MRKIMILACVAVVMAIISVAASSASAGLLRDLGSPGPEACDAIGNAGTPVNETSVYNDLCS